MNGKSARPVTIVGGGLAGLMLGIGLRSRGVPVAVWEAGHYPRHRVCGEFLHGRGQNVLEGFGLDKLLIQTGAIWAEHVAFLSGNHAGPVRTLRRRALSVSRFDLDALLAHVLKSMGGELREGTRWEEGYGEGLVRASGRRLAPVNEKPQWFGFKAHALNVALAADLEMHSLPDGYVGISRLSGGKVNICGLFRRAGLRPSSKGVPSQPAAAGTVPRTVAWKARLSGPPGTALHARLREAQFEEASLCSVAGLCIRPRLSSSEPECRIGDALTMTPPVTGNGMSMALEAADLAVEPLVDYSRGQLSWRLACAGINRACNQAFASRLAWAERLQWLMFSPLLRPLTASLLSSSMLWRTLSAKTR